MATASIPVDLFNPGQVFACLGFLEAADELLGDAEGGFDWSDDSKVRFHLNAAGEQNPFEFALTYLAEAKMLRVAPNGYTDPPTKKKGNVSSEDEEDEPSSPGDLELSEVFSSGHGDRMALPIRLRTCDQSHVDVGHWADGSTRNEFKLYAGNRSAFSIAKAMLYGTWEKPKKRQVIGDIKTRGIKALWADNRETLIAKPFDVLTLMGGSFNLDPRGGWMSIDAGYSPNKHKHHGVAASPTVEFFAAWGLEHARPDEYDTRQVRYGVWRGLVPPMLARAALSGADVTRPMRRFRFALALSGKNKVITFANEEINP